MQEHDKAIEAKEEVVNEVKDVEPKEDVVESNVEVDPDYAPAELEKAKASGYNPKGPFSPGEFNRRGELFQKIDRLNKTIEEIKRNQTKAEQQAYERGLAELNAKRLSAVENGDTESFNALDKEYNDLQRQSKPSEAAEPSPDALKFFERNGSWFNNDSAENIAMSEAAISFENKFLNSRAAKGLPPIAPEELGKQIEDYVKLKFPHRFSNPAAERPAAVEPAKTRASESPKYGIKDLTDFQKDMCEQFVAADPKNTVDDYIRLIQQAGYQFDKRK